MPLIIFIAMSVLLGSAALSAPPLDAQAPPRPNVLFIAVDDMNDWVGFLGGYPGKVHTPNIDRLAARGLAFSNAHCASPVCCPSRTAVMTGLTPSTSGVYNNQHWWRPHHPELVTIPMHFRNHGYAVAGAGKIFHHTAGGNPPDQWDEFQRLVFNDDPWFRDHKLNYPWSKPEPFPPGFPFSEVAKLPHENDWGSLPGKAEPDYDDARSVNFAIEYLNRKQTKPFFLACGLFRPHLPWYAPDKYFDLYPIEDIELPEIKLDDLKDVPKEGRDLAKARRPDFETIKSAKRWKHAIQAYLASISFADARVGRLIDGLDASPHARNTIVVLWSDHGWHHGQKNHWHKSTLWAETTRVPLIVAAPGMAGNGRPSLRPVSLVDIYPTLIELCGLSTKPELDGLSLVPLLQNPLAPRDRPAVVVFNPGQTAVVSESERLIQYSDGAREFYKHTDDPNEWRNLANVPKSQPKIDALAKWIPTNWARPAPRKSAYIFNPTNYFWTHKDSGKVVTGAAQTNARN